MNDPIQAQGEDPVDHPLAHSSTSEEEQDSSEKPLITLSEHRYRSFLNHVHQAMLTLLVAGGLILGTQYPLQTCYAYISSCLLMWVNVYFLVVGIYGVLQRKKNMAMILVGQSLILFGGLYVLTLFFKNELLWVIFGCSTWLGALFWAQMIDKIQESDPENT